MSTSVRDLIITGWVIIFAVTVGVIAFHPSVKEEGIASILLISGFSFIAMMAGILIARFTELLGRSSARIRMVALGLFIVFMLPLIPVALATFGMPWGAMVLVTLVYVRWKWALIASVN
ncbi:MAG: hypothetical protein OTJ43_00995 [Dehalococcoidia bacterium]|nr:hypothetical protein [Dehalococcoidia bacterium]